MLGDTLYLKELSNEIECVLELRLLHYNPSEHQQYCYGGLFELFVQSCHAMCEQQHRSQS